MKHLDDAQIAAAVAGLEMDGPGQEHLSSCVECHRQVGEMRDAIGARRLQMELTTPDWDAQRAAVLGRLTAGPPAPAVPSRRWWRPAMAAAAALLVVTAVVLVGPRTTEMASSGADLPVAEILAEVEVLLDDDSIPGFEVIDPGVEALEGVLANGNS